MIGPVAGSGEPRAAGEPIAIVRFEDDPVRSRPVPQPSSPSGFRYFLDGVQRTLMGYLIDGVPILTCISAAAILERAPDGSFDLMPGSLRYDHHWIVPRASGRPMLDRAAAAIEGAGGRIADPLDQLREQPERYQAELDDYAGMVEHAFQCGSKLREETEIELLEDWQGLAEPGWIVVDGALRRPVPQAVGLVKSFTRQYLTGPEANALFRLQPKHRTSAFRTQDKWRQGAWTCWYQRFWDAAGRDVRHSLVRIETASGIGGTAEIDQIAGWLLTERLPRATADERWATLLYPIHLLERILKRRIDAETRGWPVAR
jgi:hypothetical protein